MHLEKLIIILLLTISGKIKLIYSGSIVFFSFLSSYTSQSAMRLFLSIFPSSVSILPFESLPFDYYIVICRVYIVLLSITINFMVYFDVLLQLLSSIITSFSYVYI